MYGYVWMLHYPTLWYHVKGPFTSFIICWTSLDLSEIVAGLHPVECSIRHHNWRWSPGRKPWRLSPGTLLPAWQGRLFFSRGTCSFSLIWKRSILFNDVKFLQLTQLLHYLVLQCVSPQTALMFVELARRNGAEKYSVRRTRNISRWHRFFNNSLEKRLILCWLQHLLLISKAF